MSPKMFRKMLKVCRNVEERRFSAASIVINDAGFSPGGRISRPSRLFPSVSGMPQVLRYENAFRRWISEIGVSPRYLRKALATTFTVISLLVLPAASPFWARAQKLAPAKIAADLPAGTMQAKATTACTECHEARIILQQRLSKAAWTKEVDKMTKWGAVVDPADCDPLIDYLSTNFNPDKPAYEPQKTTANKSRKTSR